MTFRSTKSLLLLASALSPLFAGHALAADAAAADSNNKIGNFDDIVVTASKVNKETPITASVHTYEPQAIVSRSIIENSVSPTADFSDVVLLTPGASGTNNGNGPGLSESKTVLRGFQDGQYNVTFDGIPFGDSNDPTHHSTAYFPTGTYERIIVDRGPGSATDLGQASYGGNIHIISREATDTRSIEAQGVYGSYNTVLARGTVQTGSIKSLGDLKVVVVGEYKQTDGALTGSNAWFTNGFIKLEKPLGDNVKLSLVSSYNQDFYHQSDNNGAGCFNGPTSSRAGKVAPGNVSQATCDPLSQVGLYGKSFGLTDYKLPEFAGSHWPTARTDWNWTNKTTDFEILRLQANIGSNLTFDNKAYTYFYKNFTFSGENSTTYCGTATTTQCFISPGTNAAGAASSNTLGQTLTLNPATGKLQTNLGDIAGYTKLNQYRTSGDIAQLNLATSFGIGKVGVWYEHSVSHRYRYDYDQTAAFAAGAFNGGGHFDFAQMANFYNYRQTDKAANVQLNGQPVPLYINYDERTGWDQIQGFGEFEFKLFDDRLTITPGVKVQNFTRKINTPIAAQSSRLGIQGEASYKPTLPYAAVNYLILPNLSVYAQYAKGFLVPSLGNSLEIANPVAGGGGITGALLQPTKTTNYQAGAVYAGDRLNIDVDGYYITSSNSTFVDPSTGIATQSPSGATYKGLEGQISYVVLPGLTGIANGSINTSKNDASHLWLAQAPNYTALAGAVYNTGALKLSYLHKFTGKQYADTGQLTAISPYSTGILAAAYTFQHYTLGVTIYNLLDNTAVTKIGGSGNAASAQYFFQPGRSVEAQFRVRF